MVQINIYLFYVKGISEQDRVFNGLPIVIKLLKIILIDFVNLNLSGWLSDSIKTLYIRY